MLLRFLEDVDLIILAVDDARSTGQLSRRSIQLLLRVYTHWTENNILPKDALAENNTTLLVRADRWLDKGA